MKRRLHKIGGYSVALTLPRDWVRDHDIANTILVEKDNGRLIITPDPAKEDDK